MTRKRTKPTTAPGDGGAFLRANRPPDDLVPKEFRAVLAEVDALNTRIVEAREALADLGGPHDTGKWLQLEADARAADAKAGAQAAREGRKIDSPTAHLDDLRRRRDEARANYDALTGAIDLARNDLVEIRERAKANLDPYDKAIATARARLHKSTSEMATAARALTAALAVREWLVDHVPFDDSVALHASDVVNGLGALLGGVNHSAPPVRLASIVEAINNL